MSGDDLPTATQALHRLWHAVPRGVRVLNEADYEMVSAALAAATEPPDEPTDDDLTELRRHVEAMADEGLSFASAHAYQEARQALADAAPRLIAEVERLRAAAPASEDDEATR